MDNFNNSDGFLDNNWHELYYERHKPEDETELIGQHDDKIDVTDKIRKYKSPVLTFQLILALCLLLFLFVIKLLNLPLYDFVMSKYNVYMSESVIYDGNFKDFDFSFLSSTADEI